MANTINDTIYYFPKLDTAKKITDPKTKKSFTLSAEKGKKPGKIGDGKTFAVLDTWKKSGFKDSAGSFTIAFIAKANNVNSAYCFSCGEYDHRLSVLIQNGTNKVALDCGNGGYDLEISFSSPIKKTYFFVFRYDHTTKERSIWFNGTKTISDTIQFPIKNIIDKKITIGSLGGRSDYEADQSYSILGEISDFRMYNFALTDDQITEIYDLDKFSLVPKSYLFPDFDKAGKAYEFYNKKSYPLKGYSGKKFGDGQTYFEFNDTDTLGITNNDFTISALVAFPQGFQKKDQYTGGIKSYYLLGAQKKLKGPNKTLSIGITNENQTPCLDFQGNKLNSKTKLDKSLQHLTYCFAKDAKKAYIYLNGEQIAVEDNPNGLVANNKLFVGNYLPEGSNGLNVFRGEMNWFRIIPLALRANEVKLLAQTDAYPNQVFYSPEANLICASAYGMYSTLSKLGDKASGPVISKSFSICVDICINTVGLNQTIFVFDKGTKSEFSCNIKYNKIGYDIVFNNGKKVWLNSNYLLMPGGEYSLTVLFDQKGKKVSCYINGGDELSKAMDASVSGKFSAIELSKSDQKVKLSQLRVFNTALTLDAIKQRSTFTKQMMSQTLYYPNLLPFSPTPNIRWDHIIDYSGFGRHARAINAGIGKGNLLTQVNIPFDSSLLHLQSRFAISVMININKMVEDQTILSMGTNTSEIVSLKILQNGSIQANAFGNTLDASPSISPNTWQNLVWGYDPNTQKQVIYINGNLDSKAAIKHPAKPATSTIQYLGKSTLLDNPSPLNGQVTAFRILGEIPDAKTIAILNTTDSPSPFFSIQPDAQHKQVWDKGSSPTQNPVSFKGSIGAIGKHSYIDLKKSDPFSLSASVLNLSTFTISFWYKLGVTTDLNDVPILSLSTSEGNTLKVGTLADGFLNYEVQIKGGTKVNQKMTPDYMPLPDTKRWHYYTLVCNAGELQSYIDGQFIGKATPFEKNFATQEILKLEVGANKNGLLSDLQVYTYALKEFEIEALLEPAAGSFGEMTYYEDPLHGANGKAEFIVNITPLEVSSNDFLTLTSFSVSAMVYVDSSLKNSSQCTLLSAVTAQNSKSFLPDFKVSKQKVMINGQAVDDTLSNKHWTHIICSYDETNNSVNVYLNGIFAQTIVLSKPYKSSKGDGYQMQLHTYVEPHNSYSASIGEWRLFDHVVSKEQINQIVNYDLNRLRLELLVNKSGEVSTTVPLPTTINNLAVVKEAPFNSFELPQKPVSLPPFNIKGSEMTFMFWYRGDSPFDLFNYGPVPDTGGDFIFEAGFNDPVHHVPSYRFSNTNNYINFPMVNDAYNNNYSFAEITDGNWHHIAFSLHFDIGKKVPHWITYVDGKQKSVSNGMPGANPMLALSGYFDAPTIGGPNAKGGISNLRVFNKVLSNGQIQGYMDLDNNELGKLLQTFKQTPDSLYFSGIPNNNLKDISGAKFSPFFEKEIEVAQGVTTIKQINTKLLPVQEIDTKPDHFYFDGDEKCLLLPTYLLPEYPKAFCITCWGWDETAAVEKSGFSYGGNFQPPTGKITSLAIPQRIPNLLVIKHLKNKKDVSVELVNLNDGTIAKPLIKPISINKKNDTISIGLDSVKLGNSHGFIINDYDFTKPPFYNDPMSFMRYADQHNLYTIPGPPPIDIHTTSDLHINESDPEKEKWNIDLSIPDGHEYKAYLPSSTEKIADANHHHFRIELKENELKETSKLKILNADYKIGFEKSNGSITAIYFLYTGTSQNFADTTLNLQGYHIYSYPGPRSILLSLKSGPFMQIIGKGQARPWKEIAGGYFETLSMIPFPCKVVDDKSDVEKSPLEFTMVNPFQELNTLSITDDQENQWLKIELHNPLKDDVVFEKLEKDTPTEYNNHFQLKFRPGTLIKNDKTEFTIEAIDANSNKTWRLAAALDKNSVQVQRIYFLCLEDKFQIDAGSRLILKVDGFIVNPLGGSRMTQVDMELGYRVINTSTKANLAGICHVPTRVVDRLGQAHLPLYFAAIDAEQVITGQNTSLTLQLANQSTDQAFTLTSNYAATKEPSRFIITVAMQKDPAKPVDWALFVDPSTDGKNVLSAFKETDLFKAATPVQNGHLVQYTLEVKQLKTVNPFDTIQIELDNILSTMGAGYAMIHVNWENIPNFWDGHSSCRVERVSTKVGGQLLPFSFSVVPGSRIKKGAENSNLNFQLINQSLSQAFTLTPNHPGTNQPSRFTITVAQQNNAANPVNGAFFLKDDDHGYIRGTELFKNYLNVSNGKQIQYVLDVQQPKTINPFDSIYIRLEAFLSNMEPGYAIINLAWENIPDVRDGQNSCLVERID